MTYEYSELDAKFTLWWYQTYETQPSCPLPDGSCPCMPPEVPAVFHDAPWWTPDGIGTWEDVQIWYAEETYRNCPYFIASNGGPKDLPGKYGPGTCIGGCWEEPRCVTG